jgi:hypothetical protein
VVPVGGGTEAGDEEFDEAADLGGQVAAVGPDRVDAEVRWGPIRQSGAILACRSNGMVRVSRVPSGRMPATIAYVVRSVGEAWAGKRRR